MRLLHLCLAALVLFPSSLALAQTPAPVPRAKPESTTPALYRFRNKSGKRSGWHDEKGRVAEVVSQRKLNAIATRQGERYHKGDWITVTLAEVGLDERLTRPDIDPRPDWIYIGTFPETKGLRVARSGLEILSSQIVSDGTLRYANATLRNTSDRPYNHIKVSIAYLDENDVLVGSGADIIDTLAPGEMYRVHMLVNRDDAVKMRVTYSTD